MTLDFAKLTKAADPLDLYPALGELDSWLTLAMRLLALSKLRRFELDLEPSLDDEELSDPEPLYSFLPTAAEVRRYMLLCYAPGSPLAGMSDMGRRRTQALEKAGVLKRDAIRDGWQPFLNLTEPQAGLMLTELLRLTNSRLYEMWLSNIMAFENVMRELRAPVEGLEDDKKATAYERKLKLSAESPNMDARICAMEDRLFAGDAQTTEAGTSAALGQQKTDFTGGFAEKFATNTK